MEKLPIFLTLLALAIGSGAAAESLNVRDIAAVGGADELGFRAVENKVHVHDPHATMPAALGLDHEQLTYHFEGRARRLTDVFSRVVKNIFA